MAQMIHHLALCSTTGLLSITEEQYSSLQSLYFTISTPYPFAYIS